MVQLGIDRILDDPPEELTNGSLGLVSNHSGVNSDFKPTITLLNDNGAFDLQRLFAPEHGIWGTSAPGEHLENWTDEKTGLPVISLYGAGDNSDNTPLQPGMIMNLDAVVFDIQTVGCRFFSIIYTLANVMLGAAKENKKIYVLDRPNPIAPLGVRGNRVPKDYSTFVSGRQLPIMHGMTIGEIARYFNKEFDIGANLKVVKMSGWERDVWYSEAELSWTYPTYNFPSIETAIIYPGTCFFEKVNISEGKGTIKPFEQIGAPWIDGLEWATTLEQENLNGVRFRPAEFKPRRPSEAFSLYNGKHVEGVQINITNRETIDPLRVGLTMLVSAFSNYSECECIELNGYIIDLIFGGDSLRKILLSLDERSDVGEIVDLITKGWENDVRGFLDVREEYLLY